MNVDDYYQFLRLSGVEDVFIQKAIAFLLGNGLESDKSFYNGEYRMDRKKHLSMLMLNKYITVLRNKVESSSILEWWKSIKLIDKKIRGDLHVHTIYSDGTGDLDELVRYAEHIGYSWIGFSDHSPGKGNPFRITKTSFRERHRRISELRKTTRIDIHESLEADISSSGALMFPDSFRESLDFVIASLHEDIVDEEEALKRIEKALEDPLVIAFAHPYYGIRNHASETYMKNLLYIVKSKGKAIEFNLAPQFLLRNMELADLCRGMDIPAVFSTDSHFVSSLILMRFASLYYPKIVNARILNLQNSIVTS